MAPSIPGVYFCLLALSTVLLSGRSQESCKTEEELGEKVGSVGSRIEMMEDLIRILKNEFVQIKSLSDKLSEDKGVQNPSCLPDPDVVSVRCLTCPDTTCPTPTARLKCSLPKDCLDYLEMGQKKSGVYTIYPKRSSAEPLDVFCDMETDGGGWTVFQRRDDFGEHRQSFDRNWNVYKIGFGKLTKEFWLGNEALHVLTRHDRMTLRVDLEDWEGERRYAEYQNFLVESELEKYTLMVGKYSGNAGDALSSHNGMAFTTRDRHNDDWTGRNCVQKRKGGWWYFGCSDAQLNGVYYEEGKYTSGAHDGILWYQWKKDWWYSLKFTEMKLRPRQLESVR